MGIFKRKNRSVENYYAYDTHQPILQKNAYTEYGDPNHRNLRVKYDKIAYNLVVRVANLLTARPPIFIGKDGNEMMELSESWKDEGFNDLLNDVIKATRTHGYCVTRPLKTPIAGRKFLVYDSDSILRIGYKTDLNVDFYEVLPKIEGGRETSVVHVPVQETLYPQEVIHFFIGKFDLSQQGISTLQPIWTSIVRYGEIEEAMSSYDCRIGNGVLMCAVDPQQYQGEIANLTSALKNINNRRFLLLKTGMDGKVPELKYIASNSKQDFPRDMETILKGIALATGFPLRYLIGDPKGALSAAEEDTDAVWENLNSIFQEYEPFVRKLFLSLEGGEEINASVKEIKFDNGKHLTEDKNASGKVQDA